MAEFNLPFDTEVPADVMDAVQSGFAFTPPQDAATKGDPTKPGNGIATFSQNFTITDAELAAKDDDADSYNVIVTFTVAPDAVRSYGPDPNAGRDLKAFYCLTPKANTDSNHKNFKRNRFNLSKVKQLAGVLGIYSGGPFSTALFQRQPDGTSLVAGREVHAICKNSWYEHKAKTEITDFISPEVAAS